jgi:hypothetical protein
VSSEEGSEDSTPVAASVAIALRSAYDGIRQVSSPVSGSMHTCVGCG